MFLPDLDGGGAQRTFVNLANAFGAVGVKRCLAVGRSDGPARVWLADDVPLEDLGALRLRQTPRPLRRLIQQRQPALVLSTITDANVVAALAARGLPLRLILRETNSHRTSGDLGWMRRCLAGWAYRRADAVVALSEGVRCELLDDYHLDGSRVHTIHNPVRVDDFREAAATARQQPSPALGEGPLILAVGRLTRQKGFDVLMRAFACLKHAPSRLAILGDGADREPLLRLGSELGVSDRLIMPGFVADLAPWLAHAALFVLSSRWEGFGHVLVEAMASDVPVIATRCPHGPADILRDNRTGVLVPPEEPAALATAMGQLLDDYESAKRLSKAAQSAVGKFSAPRIAGKYIRLFETLVQKQ